MSMQLIELPTEEMTAEGRSSREIVQENRDYTLFSWSVQSAANPIHMKRAQGVYNVCPVDNCIEMVEVAPERASTTWEEISQTEPAVTEDWAAMEAYRERNGIHIH